MFTAEEKNKRWLLFDLLPIDKQQHIHNLILRSAQHIAPSNKIIVLPARRIPDLRLIRIK